MPDMPNPIKQTRNDLENLLDSKSNFVLTAILVVLALGILYVAFFQKNKLVKVATILWVSLP